MNGTRLCVSGSSGSGKTTLARGLAAALRIPYCGDFVQETFTELGVESHRTCGANDLARIGERILEKRKSFQEANDSYVLDRGPVDAGAYWLRWVADVLNDEPRSAHYLGECRASAQDITDTIVLPWSRDLLVDDGIRSPNASYQFGVYCLVLGLCANWKIPVRVLDAIRESPEERLRRCLVLVREKKNLIG